MRKPLGEYEFSRTELAAFRQLVLTSASLTQLAGKIGKSKPATNEALENLCQKGFVDFERRGNLKIARVSQAKHAQLLRELFNEHPHISWENVLSYSGVLPLVRLANESSATASRTTEWRALRAMMSRGIITREDHLVKINPRFQKLEEFIREAQKYKNSRLASQISPDAVIVWSQGSEFIIRVLHGTLVTDRRFQKTATTRLAEYGIPLITNQDYYFFTSKPARLKIEDVLLHILLVDGVTNTTYALILMKKTRISKRYLIKEAARYQLSDRIEAMLRFLETHEEEPDKLLPQWEEYAEKARDYGVDL